MSRKRPAAADPEEEEDPLEKLMGVLYETSAARQALMEHSQSIQQCLRITDHLEGLLATAHQNAQSRVLWLNNETFLLQQQHPAAMASAQAAQACYQQVSFSRMLENLQGVMPTQPSDSSLPPSSSMPPPPPPPGEQRQLGAPPPEPSAGSSSEPFAPPASCPAVSGAPGASSSSALPLAGQAPMQQQPQSPQVNTHIFNLLQAQIVALQPLLQSSHQASTHFAEHMTPTALAAAQLLSQQAGPLSQQPQLEVQQQVMPLQAQPQPTQPALLGQPQLQPDQSALQAVQTQHALMQLYLQSIIMQQPQPLPLPPPPLENFPGGPVLPWSMQPDAPANIPVTQTMSSCALCSAIPVNASCFPPASASAGASGGPSGETSGGPRGGNGSSNALAAQAPVPPVPKLEAPPQAPAEAAVAAPAAAPAAPDPASAAPSVAEDERPAGSKEG